MTRQDQLELEQRTDVGMGPRALAVSPKHILVHIQNDYSVRSRLQTALSLARTFSAHVEFLHVTPIQAYVAFDGFGGVFVMNKVIDALDEQENALRERIEADLKNEDVSWEYIHVTGDTANQLVSHAALADLVVAGRAAHRSDRGRSNISLLGDLIARSRTPLFIPGEDQDSFDLTSPVLIAWDGSYEAANAVRSSIGMLKRFSDVHVVQVAEQKEETFPSTRLLEYLSRHGVHAEMTIDPIEDLEAVQEYIPDILIARAMAVNAAYLVMGGYGHSRIGEYIFGGVTRTMLAGCPIPILISR